MITPELQTYIRQQLGAGVAKDIIKQNLSTQGWNAQDLDEVFLTIESPQSVQAVQSFSSNDHKGKWMIIIILLLLISSGVAYAAYHYGLFTLLTPTTITTPPTSPIDITTTSVTTTPTPSNSNQNITTTTCDNYQCLITAASQCQPISVTISYSGLPYPLYPGMSVSGQTKYEIRKSPGINDCTLIFSSPATSFSISDKGLKAALASGITNAQIEAHLKTMNDIVKSVAETQTTCPSNASTISNYLSDVQKGYSKSTTIAASTGQTTTFTTSSGQKLVCTVSN